MKKTVTCQLALGMTRVSGYTLYDHESMSFEETTPREVKRLIREGAVNGLILDETDEIQLDEEGFNCKNILVKSGVGNYRSLKSGILAGGSSWYALTKVADTDDGLIYEVVNNLCARLPLEERMIKSLYNLGSLVGCWVNNDTGMITFATGVEFVDMTTAHLKELKEAAAAKAAAKAADAAADAAAEKVAKAIVAAAKEETATELSKDILDELFGSDASKGDAGSEGEDNADDEDDTNTNVYPDEGGGVVPVASTEEVAAPLEVTTKPVARANPTNNVFEELVSYGNESSSSGNSDKTSKGEGETSSKRRKNK